MNDLITFVIVAVALIAIFGLISALPVMLLWNWLMPELFGLTQITFMQALGLSLLTNILFGSSSGSKK